MNCLFYYYNQNFTLRPCITLLKPQAIPVAIPAVEKEKVHTHIFRLNINKKYNRNSNI